MTRGKEDNFILALLNANTTREACRTARVSERAGYSMLARPDFQAKYKKAKDELFTNAVNVLRRNIGRSVEVTAEIMNSPDSAPFVRLSAARLILEMGLKAIETNDVLERLQAIEARISAENSINSGGF